MACSSNFVQANGKRMHYLEWDSSGPRILLLHAGGLCGGVFEPLGDCLSPDYSVVALDLLGAGLSEKSDSYDGLWVTGPDQVRAVMQSLDLRDVLLVSHSVGGDFGLLAASACPERVRGIVAYEPSLAFAGGRTAPPDAQAFLEQRAKRRSTFADRTEMSEHFRGRGGFANWRDDYFQAYVRHGAVEREDGSVALAISPTEEALAHLASFDLSGWTNLRRCETPLLLVLGESGGQMMFGSIYGKRDPVETIRPFFPNLRTATMPQCSHFGPMERPDLFEEIVRDFAASLP